MTSERYILEDEIKTSKALLPYRTYCKKCGHTLFIADSKHTNGQMLCSHCGTMNYTKKRSFKNELLKRIGGKHEKLNKRN